MSDLAEDARAEALRRSIAARLMLRTFDELHVIERVLAGLEQGAEEYGALDIENDSRRWNAEAEQELRDLLVYLACDFIARQRARIRRIECEIADEESPIERGLAELKKATE